MEPQCKGPKEVASVICQIFDTCPIKDVLRDCYEINIDRQWISVILFGIHVIDFYYLPINYGVPMTFDADKGFRVVPVGQNINKEVLSKSDIGKLLSTSPPKIFENKLNLGIIIAKFAAIQCLPPPVAEEIWHFLQHSWQ